MASKRRKSGAAATKDRRTAVQSEPAIIVGDFHSRHAVTALDVAELLLRSNTVPEVRRIVAKWFVSTILSSKRPTEEPSFGYILFLANAFQYEWQRHISGGENDAEWLRQLLREMVAVVDDDTGSYLLMGCFGQLFLDHEIRAFFGDWTERGDVLSDFYAEACEFADKCNAVAEAMRPGRGDG